MAADLMSTPITYLGNESKKLNCEASQLILSTPTDKSAVTITQVAAFTSLLSPVAHPVGGTETVVVNDPQQVYKSITNKPKPKFIIGDLEEGGVEFPVSYTNTEVRDDLEGPELVHLNAAAHRHRDAINNDESHHYGDRPWTLAGALTDEKITNDGLVKVLDRMRDDSMGKEDDDRVGLGALDVEKEILEGWGTGIPDAGGGDESRDDTRQILDEEVESGHATLSESPVGEYGYPFQTEVSSSSNIYGVNRYPKTMRQHIRSRSTPSHAWLAAQRALLTCRELILTERHYVAQLSALVQQQTTTPPPPLMCDCAQELLQACERLLRGMEKDPSARGVAAAFLEGEKEVQSAYIRWCGVVGEWFSGDGDRQDSASVGRPSLDLSEVTNRVRHLSVKRRNRVGSKTDVDKPSPVSGSEGEAAVTPLKRTVSTWRKSMPTLGFDTPSLYGGSDRKKDKETEQEPKKPTVRALAILPTQRVMRYGLIYQELLSHTPPSSPSRTFVEHAAHAAAHIAKKCNLAQENVTFIASSNGGVSRTRSSSRTGAPAPPSKVPPLPMSLVTAEPLTYNTAPASPISIRSVADSPSRSYTQYFQSSDNKSSTDDFITGPRRLSASFLSLGWGRSNKQKTPAGTERIQVVQSAAGTVSLTSRA